MNTLGEKRIIAIYIRNIQFLHNAFTAIKAD